MNEKKCFKIFNLGEMDSLLSDKRFLCNLDMTEANNNQNYQEDIKPNITQDEIKTVLSKFYGLKGGCFTQLQGYDDLNYHCQPNISCNPFIKTLWPHGYVLKVMNSLDSVKNDLCEAQNAMLLFLRKRNIPSPLPVQTMRGEYYKKAKFPLQPKGKEIQKEHIIRLLEFQYGTVLKESPKNNSIFYKLGLFLANLDEALKEFSHPVYENHNSIWHLNSITELKFMTQIIKTPKRKELVENIINRFTLEVVEKAKSFERGMIHGDFNEHNVLMGKTQNEEWEVSAILDFGDSHYSCYLFELAVALCYMMFECKRHFINPVVGAGHLLAGYLTIRSSLSIDFALLKLSICARICQSLILGLKAFSLHPENKYVLDSQEMGWPLLEELWEISEEKITEEWESVIQSYNIH